MLLTVYRYRLSLALGAAVSVLAGYVGVSCFQGHGTVLAPKSYQEIHRGHLARLDANAASGRVVFLGSSTLQGLDASPITPFPLNLSLGGDTVQGLVSRAQSYRSIQSAKAIVLNIGFNDIINDCKRLSAVSLDSLFELLPPSTPMLIIALQGVNPQIHGEKCMGKISNLIAITNVELTQRCAVRANCRFVANPIPEHSDAIISNQLHEADGIHLSAMAYEHLRADLRAALISLNPNLVVAEAMP